MFDVGFGEVGVLAVLALLIFGPDQLPKMATQAGRALRQLRQMADGARDDLRSGLGPEYANFDPADLNPRRFVRKHLFEDDDTVDGGQTPDYYAPDLKYGERPPFDAEAT